MSTTAQRLHTFVNFVSDHLKGDEKGEAQLFLDKFFRAFGHEGAIEAGATRQEVAETIGLAALFGGVPAMNKAMELATEALDTEGKA